MKARELFEKQCAAGRFPGGQLVVRHKGEVVLDCAIGTARGFRGEAPAAPLTSATRFAVFSATKPVVALAVAMLEERGVIDVDAPVARYFPAFSANGKADLTVLDVLTHRACVFTPGLIATPTDWGNNERVREALIAATPRYPRGTLAYMPYEFGWILAEVVHGATGDTLETFIRSEIAGPAELPSLATTYWVGTKSVSVAGVELTTTFEHDNNLPEVLTAFVPGAGLVCTAHDLAAFYEVLAHGGVTRNGWWGTQHAFGHAGAFSTLAWADPTIDLAAAIVTNGNRGPTESLFRFAPIGSALRRALR